MENKNKELFVLCCLGTCAIALLGLNRFKAVQLQSKLKVRELPAALSRGRLSRRPSRLEHFGSSAALQQFAVAHRPQPIEMQPFFAVSSYPAGFILCVLFIAVIRKWKEPVVLHGNMVCVDLRAAPQFTWFHRMEASTLTFLICPSFSLTQSWMPTRMNTFSQLKPLSPNWSTLLKMLEHRFNHHYLIFAVVKMQMFFRKSFFSNQETWPKSWNYPFKKANQESSNRNWNNAFKKSFGSLSRKFGNTAEVAGRF